MIHPTKVVDQVVQLNFTVTLLAKFLGLSTSNFLSNRHIVTQQLNSQAVHGHKLCAVCLGRSNRNFRSSKCVKHIVCFTWPF